MHVGEMVGCIFPLGRALSTGARADIAILENGIWNWALSNMAPFFQLFCEQAEVAGTSKTSGSSQARKPTEVEWLPIQSVGFEGWRKEKLRKGEDNKKW